MSSLIRQLKGLFIRNKKRDLREICLEMYGKEFVEKYDTLNGGGEIGGFKETVEFLDKLSRAQKIRGKR